MTKLLTVTTISATLQAFLLPFASHFRSKGWKVDAIAQDASTNLECLEHYDQVWDVEWSRNPLTLNNLTSVPPKIRAIVHQGNYDIVHVHTPVAAFVTRLALKDLSKTGCPKIIYTAHGFHFYQGGSFLKNAIFLALEKLAGQWTDYLVVINREDEATAKRYRLLSPASIRYMPGIGVDTDYYSPDAVSHDSLGQVRQELGLAQKSPLLLCVAEFIPRKHHRDILRAFASVARTDAHLAFAGTGPLMKDMQQLAVELGIDHRLHFLGKREDVPTLMRAAVATVLASEQEGLPRSVMESLCMEVPVIGTNIRGTRDLLKEDCGLLVKVGDVEGLAQAMMWILDHPEAAQAMGKCGRKHMADDYSLKHILRLYEALYAEAIKEVNSPVY